MVKLELHFYEGQLAQTHFEHPLLAAPCVSVRGKSAGAYRGSGSFQWSFAVQALSMLLARAFVAARTGTQGVLILGEQGTPAASLDFAIDKQPMWLIDMLGADSKGTSLARRMLRRTNPNRKRPGPVVLTLNEHFLPASAVELYCDGQLATAESAAALLAALEQGWRAGEALRAVA
jgi:hypothetical protein